MTTKETSLALQDLVPLLPSSALQPLVDAASDNFDMVATHPSHIAPRGAKKEEAFGGVILKSERPSGALFTNSGPPFFTVESKIEVLSPLGTSFH
jgi:hypothetical protein